MSIKNHLLFVVLVGTLTSCNTVLRGLGVIKKPKVITIENMLEVGLSHGLTKEDVFYYFPSDTLNISYPYWPEKLVEEDGFVYVFDDEGYLIEFESSCVGHPLKYLEGEIDSAMFKNTHDSISEKVHIRDFLSLKGWDLIAAKDVMIFEDYSIQKKTVVVYWSRWQYYFTKRNIRDVTSMNLPNDSVRVLFINTDPIEEWYE